MGFALEPMIKGLTRAATAMSRFVANNPKVSKLLGTLLAITAAVTALSFTLGIAGGAVVAGLNMIWAALGSIKVVLIAIKYHFLATLAMNPMILAIAGTIALVAWASYQVYKHWDDVKWAAGLVWEMIKKIGGTIWNALISPFELMVDIFMALQDNTLTFGEKIKAIGVLIKDHLLAPFRKIHDVWEKITSLGGLISGRNMPSEFSSEFRKSALERAAQRANDAAAGGYWGGISPLDNAVTTQANQTVTVVIDGAIEIEDKTGMASAVGGGGGDVPINVRPRNSYWGGGR
ncbi:hypothetical protein KAR91_76960, partial [Candidatus Pacearchaeota archaeon]|nr:hypothetical protein [Candidatus Pacearchaeota archaeon]